MAKYKPPLSSRPPSINKETADDFINAANTPNNSGSFALNNEKKEHIKKHIFPWEDEKVRDDLKKVFNLRLTERYFLKLEYLAEISNTTKHQLCMGILLKEIDKRLNLK